MEQENEFNSKFAPGSRTKKLQESLTEIANKPVITKHSNQISVPKKPGVAQKITKNFELQQQKADMAVVSNSLPQPGKLQHDFGEMSTKNFKTLRKPIKERKSVLIVFIDNGKSLVNQTMFNSIKQKFQTDGYSVFTTEITDEYMDKLGKSSLPDSLVTEEIDRVKRAQLLVFQFEVSETLGYPSVLHRWFELLQPLSPDLYNNKDKKVTHAMISYSACVSESESDKVTPHISYLENHLISAFGCEVLSACSFYQKTEQLSDNQSLQITDLFSQIII